MPTPRLIEKWLPLKESSIEAVREGGALAGHPPVNQLHVWWSRKPLFTSRAVTAATALADNSDKSAFLKKVGTTEQVVTARGQMDAIKASGAWSDIKFPNERAFLHNPDSIFPIGEEYTLLDLTAGGGSIPFEAGRLGFQTIANELNPVASFILKATCQWPQEYGYALLDDYKEVSQAYLARVNELLADVYPEEPAPDCASGDCPHPQRYQCSENCATPDTCNHHHTGSKLHRTVLPTRYVWSYLVGRTVFCPSCEAEIILNVHWRLDAKGTGMRLTAQDKHTNLEIVHDQNSCPDCKRKTYCNLATQYPNSEISPGTVTRAIATCIHCGSTTPKGYTAKESQANRMGERLYCVIYRDSWREKNKDGRDSKKLTTYRVFATPSAIHRENSDFIARETKRRTPDWEEANLLPNEVIPDGNNTKNPISYGIPTWREMFSTRQQMAHAYCVQAYREGVDGDNAANQLDERRRAAWGYIALALDKMINRNCLLTRWEERSSAIVGTFDGHYFGFKHAYAEMAVTCQGLGLEWGLNDIRECLSSIINMVGHKKNPSQLVDLETESTTAKPTQVHQGDARHLPLDSSSIDTIVFDPPYETNICYAELSDFFYVWLKRTAGYVFPEDFTAYLTEKEEEAIASPVRFKDQATKGASAQKLALQDYQEKMATIFKEARRVIKEDGIMTVMFNHKSTAAWDALTVALIEAGFCITRTWPLKTEADSSLHIKDKAATITTILLVCRPRGHNPNPKPWHEVEAEIAQAVQEDIVENLQPADLRPIDLYLSAFGPALKVISENWGTERESANPDPQRKAEPFKVTPTDALQVARREVSRHRSRELSAAWENRPWDSYTKFYILAKDQAENDAMLFDEANLLARAIGVGLDKADPRIKSLISIKADKATLLTAKDRMAQGFLGEDQNPGTTLDVVQTAVALTERRNTLEARQWLTQRLHDPNDEGFKTTLEVLLRTTKSGHDDYQAQQDLWQLLYAGPPPAPAATMDRMEGF